MSIQFERPMNEATEKLIKEMFKEKVAAIDEQTALINSNYIAGTDMKQIANTANQPASVVLHDEGEIKTMSDGTQYRVDPKGWRRITP